MLKTAFLVGIIIALNLEANAGWVIVESAGNSLSGISTRSTLFIQNNMIKSVNPDHVMIFDLDRWRLTYLNPALSGYWTGSPSEYMAFEKEHILAFLEEEISLADEYDKPFLIAMYEDLKFDKEQGSDAVSFMGELPVEIILTDEAERILGYQANQFVVYIDREKVEEIWLTREISLSEEYDYETFRSFIDEMSWGNMFQDYRSTERYIHLMKSGLPLRTVEAGENGSFSRTEVVSIERKSIPASEFSPPSHYRLMNLSELGLEHQWQ